jgi:hypothetical protein
MSQGLAAAPADVAVAAAAPSYTVSAAGELTALASSDGATHYPLHPAGDKSSLRLLVDLGDGHAGKSAGLQPVVLTAAAGTPGLYSGKVSPSSLTLTIGYGLSDDKTAVKLRVTCAASASAQPATATCLQLRLLTGVDMSMASYPSYNSKMMPTGQCAGGQALGPGPGCGSTSIMLSPDGKALLWASPQPLDSYQICFADLWGGHRINTLAFDLIDAVNPRNHGFTHSPPVFKASETRSWDFFVAPLPTRSGAAGGGAYEQTLNDAFGSAVVRLLGKPAACWTDWAGLKSRELVVYTDAAKVIDGMTGNANLHFKSAGAGRQLPTQSPVKVLATTYQVMHKQPLLPAAPATMALFYHQQGISKAAVVGSAAFPWSWAWYANVASSFVAKWVQPKCGQSCEQYMSAFALCAAQRFGGRSASRQALLEGFVDSDLMAIQFDKKTIKDPTADELLGQPGRIQNTSCAMDICRMTYLAAVAQTPPSPDVSRFLDYALDLAKVLLRHQTEGGGLFDGTNFYTSVYYPAKSLMDLADTLAGIPARAADAAALQPHITACLHDLLKRGDNIGTEGQTTYEDGAIACTALQLAQFATHGSTPPADAAKFVAAAKTIADGHRCLEYRSMDSICNGASMRFWESFWGIGWSNCLNTPHGWSSWTGAMHYQLYLATKDTHHLHKFLTNVTASLEALISPRGDVRGDDNLSGGSGANGMCYCMYTPDPTISNPQREKVAGTTQLDIPSGEQLRKNTMGEPFEVIKLLHDTVLVHAHVYWHAGAWRAIGAELAPQDGKEGWLRVVPSDGIEVVFLNYESAPSEEACVFELVAVSEAGARAEVMPRAGQEPAGAGVVECEDDGWVLA